MILVKLPLNLSRTIVKNIEEIFYLLFIPMIPHEQINFVNSITYLGRPGLYTGVDYIDVKSIEDYMSQSVLLEFEKVSLSTKFSNMDIILIQGLSRPFFSSRLIDEITSKKISNYFFPPNSVELVFQ